MVFHRTLNCSNGFGIYVRKTEFILIYWEFIVIVYRYTSDQINVSLFSVILSKVWNVRFSAIQIRSLTIPILYENVCPTFNLKRNSLIQIYSFLFLNFNSYIVITNITILCDRSDFDVLKTPKKITLRSK